jgi:hypothetical protein
MMIQEAHGWPIKTNPRIKSQNSRQEAWLQLGGILKDIYAAYGGGEAYLRQECEAFKRDMDHREALIAEAMGLPPDGADFET